MQLVEVEEIALEAAESELVGEQPVEGLQAAASLQGEEKQAAWGRVVRE